MNDIGPTTSEKLHLQSEAGRTNRRTHGQPKKNYMPPYYRMRGNKNENLREWSEYIVSCFSK
jgi:hypothetical protein